MRRATAWALVSACLLSPGIVRAEPNLGQLFGGASAAKAEERKPFDFGLSEPSAAEKLAREIVGARREASAASGARERLDRAAAQGMEVRVPPQADRRIQEQALKKPAAERAAFIENKRWEWLLSASSNQLQEAIVNVPRPELHRDLAFDLQRVLSSARRSEGVEARVKLHEIAAPYIHELSLAALKLTSEAVSRDGRVIDAAKLVPAKRAWSHVLKEVGHDGLMPDAKTTKFALGQFGFVDLALRKQGPRSSLRQLFASGSGFEAPPARPPLPSKAATPHLATKIPGYKAPAEKPTPAAEFAGMNKARNPRVLQRWLRWVKGTRLWQRLRPRARTPQR